MMDSFRSNLERKAAMYEMLLALESDFINNFYYKLEMSDLPQKIIEESTPSKNDDLFLSILQGLDFQAYIEICNANIVRLQFSKEEKDFLNKEFKNIIPIRNNVMHPRPLGVLDYHIVKGIFDDIDRVLFNFSWDNVKIVRRKIVENPEELKLPPQNLRKSDNVIENIPTTVDFEDTSFIGRRREIGELKAKLSKNNVHILSIIGDGGIGKTAIAIKLLYDLLDDEKSNFNLILWASLKTNELNNYEFREIKNSIKTAGEMYAKLGAFVGASEVNSVQDYLIDLAKEFNMLLVLDNLETINTDDIKEFLDRFTEYGKVLITSRIGLGEMEHRYRLGGLAEDDVMEYMNILLELYGFEAMMTEEKKRDIAIKQLYANPLAIKWFVRCMYNGDDIDDILKNKSELSSFCMSNVYDKLEKRAHEVLDILLVANRDLSFAELMYYLGLGVEEYKDISYAINDLIKCNFIDDIRFKIEEKLSITSFAKEFLKQNYIENIELASSYKQKEMKLQTFFQNQLQTKARSPYGIKSFGVESNESEKLVAAFFLNEAIVNFNRKEVNLAFKNVELAKKLAPNYYQCNKIAAYLYGKTSREKAKEEYSIAIQCCENQDELVDIYINYAGYLLRCNDYVGAIEQLENAELTSKELNVHIVLEKAKVLSCVGRYDEAYETLDKVDFSELSLSERNIYLTRKADIKRRESERYDQRDVEQQLTLIKDAFDILDLSEEPDRGIYQYRALLVKMLSYLYYDEASMVFLNKVLAKYYYKIRREANYRAFMDNMSGKIDLVGDEKICREIKKYLTDFNQKIEVLKDDEGIVYVINYEKQFGFFRNLKYPQGVYFKLTAKTGKVQLGDIVKYDCVVETGRGIMANRIINYR